MSENTDTPAPQGYEVTLCTPETLDEKSLAVCIEILKKGEAVDVDVAKRELSRARAVALARKDGRIVGVGAIKRIRLHYAAGRAKLSGKSFPPDTPELGYVAVDPGHKGLSYPIVCELLTTHDGTLFATTFSDKMKTTLRKTGFAQKGHEWIGDGGDRVSLWLRG